MRDFGRFSREEAVKFYVNFPIDFFTTARLKKCLLNFLQRTFPFPRVASAPNSSHLFSHKKMNKCHDPTNYSSPPLPFSTPVGLGLGLGFAHICSASLHLWLASLGKFKSQHVRVLVATDVASRGVDIPTVDLVLNCELPCRAVDYIHRVGRTRLCTYFI